MIVRGTALHSNGGYWPCKKYPFTQYPVMSIRSYHLPSYCALSRFPVKIALLWQLIRLKGRRLKVFGLYPTCDKVCCCNYWRAWKTCIELYMNNNKYLYWEILWSFRYTLRINLCILNILFWVLWIICTGTSSIYFKSIGFYFIQIIVDMIPIKLE
jgi:hypothetical protein